MTVQQRCSICGGGERNAGRSRAPGIAAGGEGMWGRCLPSGAGTVDPKGCVRSVVAVEWVYRFVCRPMRTQYRGGNRPGNRRNAGRNRTPGIAAGGERMTVQWRCSICGGGERNVGRNRSPGIAAGGERMTVQRRCSICGGGGRNAGRNRTPGIAAGGEGMWGRCLPSGAGTVDPKGCVRSVVAVEWVYRFVCRPMRTQYRGGKRPGNRCGRRRNVGSVSAAGGGHGRSERLRPKRGRGRMDEGITAIGRAQTDDCGRTGRNGPKGIRLQVGGARMRAAGLRGGRCRGAVRGACYRASSHPR